MKKWCYAGCLSCLLIAFLSMGAFAGVERIPLENADCAKCHPKETQDLKDKGAKHADLGCVDCHPEHPPLGKDVISACDACHDPGSSAHYAIEDCKGCHVTHRPTEIDFSKVATVKRACISCHPEQGKAMTERPSSHSEMDCLECHASHKESAGCLDCHDAHAEGMAMADCKGCHATHSPKDPVAYGSSVPDKHCACCHGEAAELLVKSKNAHTDLACVECHVATHGSATACTDCHEANLHGDNMHKKFPECLTCHMDPHSLGK